MVSLKLGASVLLIIHVSAYISATTYTMIPKFGAVVVHALISLYAKIKILKIIRFAHF